MNLPNRQSPPKPSRDVRREAILKIAYDAFLTDGYAATSMSSIAAKVGGSKATLYNYFSSKEELFAAVIDEKCHDIHAILFEIEFETADFPSTLRKLGERFVRLLLSDDKIATYRLITAETARFPELGRAFYHSGPEQGKTMLAEYFDRAVGEGNMKPGDTRVMASQFFDLCRGELHHKKLWNVAPDPSDDEIRDTVAQAVGVFLAAYGSARATGG